MNHNGFTISFPAGARGRLIANVLNGMVNKIDDPIEYTEYGSAHVHQEKSYIRKIDDPLIFKPQSDMVYECVPIFITHDFPDIPVWDKNIYFQNNKVIVINVDDEDINEILLNQIIKNIFPRIDSFVNDKPLESEELQLLYAYRRVFSVHGIVFDKQLLSDSERITYLLKTGLTNRYLRAKINAQFYGTALQDSERILNLKYKHLFSKENGKYRTLEKMAKWLKIEYNDTVEKSFEHYDNIKYDIFQKYCPWFLQENP
jgi:predicted transcriptional regulator